MSERDDMKAAYQRERDWRIAAQSVAEDLEGALRALVDANACAILHRESGIWKDAETLLASLPSPEPTQPAMTTVVDGFTGRTMHVHDGTAYHPDFGGLCQGCFPPTQQEDG